LRFAGRLSAVTDIVDGTSSAIRLRRGPRSLARCGRIARAGVGDAREMGLIWFGLQRTEW